MTFSSTVNVVGGLEGGGTSGNVKIGIDSGGVTTGRIADGTIMDVDISASAAIATSRISGTAVDLTSTQTIAGDKSFSGELSILRGGDFFLGDSTVRANNSGMVVGSRWPPTVLGLLRVSRSFTATNYRHGIHVDLENAIWGEVYGLYSRASAATASPLPPTNPGSKSPG